MRKLGWGLGLLLSGGLIGLLTMPGWLPGLIHRQAQHWAEETHHRLVIGSLEVGVFPFRVHAHAVRLYEADGQTLVVGCEDLDGRLALYSALRPIPVIDELILTHPVVHLIRSPAGEWNLARLAGPSSGGGFPLLVKKVRILRGEGSVWDQGNGLRHDIRNLQFELPRLSFQNRDTWLFPSLHAELDGASIALVARIRPFSSRLEGEGDLSVRGFDLMRVLAPWVPPWSVSPGVLTTHFAFWGSDWGALQGELSGLHWTTDQVLWRGAGLEGVQLSAQVKKTGLARLFSSVFDAAGGRAGPNSNGWPRGLDDPHGALDRACPTPGFTALPALVDLVCPGPAGTWAVILGRGSGRNLLCATALAGALSRAGTGRWVGGARRSARPTAVAQQEPARAGGSHLESPASDPGSGGIRRFLCPTPPLAGCNPELGEFAQSLARLSKICGIPPSPGGGGPAQGFIGCGAGSVSGDPQGHPAGGDDPLSG